MDILLEAEIVTGTVVFSDLTVIKPPVFIKRMYKSPHTSTIIQSTFPWTHAEVYSKDPRDRNPKMLTYTEAEFNLLNFDKANKTGPTVHGEIALLDSEGDLVDSDIHPDDLIVHVLDFGEF